MFYILSAIFLWSSIGIVIRLSGVPVHLLIFFSCLISASVTGLAFLNREFRYKVPSGRGLLYLIVLGPISLVNTFSFYYAYGNTSIANAVLTHYTAPLLVALLAPVFLKEKLTVRVVLSVTAATAGLWIMFDVSPGHFYELVIAGDRNTGGIFAGLLSGFAYAVLIIIFKIFVQDFSPVLMTFFQNGIIALILFPFIKISMGLTSALWAFAVMGIVHSIIAPILYFRGMRDVTANKAAILGYLEPVSAILMGMLFLNEAVSYKTLIGGSMILFSGYLTIKNSSD